MEANELMIGDWVNIYVFPNDEPKGDALFPARINAILSDSEDVECGFALNGEGKVGYASRPAGTCLPIPLTPEILEKNGFERCVSSIVRTPTAAIPVCDSNQFATSDHPNLRIIDRGIWHYSLRIPVVCDTNHYEIHEIKYVHELQHALRLCGIDKTIEL